MSLCLLVLHTNNCQFAFYTYDFQPFPEIPPKLHSLLFENDPVTNESRATGRVASWVHNRSDDSNYGLLMNHDLPSVYRLPTFDGYNPLFNGKPQVGLAWQALFRNPIEAMKAYGLRWHFSHHPHRVPALCPVYSLTWEEEARDKRSLFEGRLRLEDLRQVFDEDGIVVNELPQVDPLAFPKGQPEKSLHVNMSGRGIDVDITTLDKEQLVVVNFLHYPNISAYVDGKEVHCDFDDYHRIVVPVPAGEHRLLAIHYCPPWATGLLLGLGVLAAGIALGGLLLIRRQSEARP